MYEFRPVSHFRRRTGLPGAPVSIGSVVNGALYITGRLTTDDEFDAEGHRLDRLLTDELKRIIVEEASALMGAPSDVWISQGARRRGSQLGAEGTNDLSRANRERRWGKDSLARQRPAFGRPAGPTVNRT
jgi:hypothetical protein